MPDLPHKLYFRRGEVREWFGFSEQMMTKLIEAGTLRPVYLAGAAQMLFARQNLLELLPTTDPREVNHSTTKD